MEFYFVRHGVTENNAQHLFNGSNVDTALTASGAQGAVDLGCYLQDVQFDGVFVSPQGRAQRTAELVLQQAHMVQPTMTVVDALHEIDFGTWDGTGVDAHPNEPMLDNYFHHPELFDGHEHGAENYDELVARGQRALTEIYAASHGHGKVLVVSHGILLSMTLKTLLGVPIAQLRAQPPVRNASLTIMRTTDGQRFERVLWDFVPEG